MIVTKRFPVSHGFNNVFDDLFGTLPSNLKGEKNDSGIPVNIVESEKGYEISLNAPVRKKEAFKLNIENGLLSVGYEKAEDEKVSATKFVRREFDNGSFKRTFSLDEKVNGDEIEAKYENGVLAIFVPKKQIIKNSSKQISIQ